MTISTTCKGWGIEITGEDEDDLVAQVQRHLAAVHPSGHSPSREQVLAVIRARAVSGS
jgi:hypothetical protein